MVEQGFWRGNFIDLMVQTIKLKSASAFHLTSTRLCKIHSEQRKMKQRERPCILIELALLIVQFPGVC